MMEANDISLYTSYMWLPRDQSQKIYPQKNPTNSFVNSYEPSPVESKYAREFFPD
jgi:hypothetical protein